MATIQPSWHLKKMFPQGKLAEFFLIKHAKLLWSLFSLRTGTWQKRLVKNSQSPKI